MEKSILLLQTEIMILSHIGNSMKETVAAMKGRIGYETMHHMNRAVQLLEIDIINKEIEIGRLKEI